MKTKYLKSPLNYIGGKYKILEDILPIFPEEIDTFVDLFGGGLNVGINVDSNLIIYNDILPQVTQLLNYLYCNDIDFLLSEIDKVINNYGLSKTNREGFLQLRQDFNSSEFNPLLFYVLICYSFNNQIRFNKKDEYNMTFGENRSSFNPMLKKRFINFCEGLKKKNIIFNNFDFEKLDIPDNSFVYCDPPYLGTCATYNEQGGWTEKDELRLLQFLDKLNERGIKFALSNNLKYKNKLLEEWKDKYDYKFLDANYNNCNYQKKDKSADKEIIIFNY